uniref:F-box domain-containing protein n=1 Tax=Trichuris muris TaxID=70415 RepID=A0A5S6QPI6_TRIMR
MTSAGENGDVIVVDKCEDNDEMKCAESNLYELSEMACTSMDGSTERCLLWEPMPAPHNLSLSDIPLLPMSIIVNYLPIRDRISLARTCKKFWESFGRFPVNKEYVNIRTDLRELFPGEVNDDTFRSSHTLSIWVKRLFRACNPNLIQCLSFGRDSRCRRHVCITHFDSSDLDEWFQLLPANRIVGLEMDFCILDYRSIKLISDRFRNLQYFRFSKRCISNNLKRKMKRSVSRALAYFPSDVGMLHCKISGSEALTPRLEDFLNCLAFYMSNLNEIHFLE